MSLGKFLVQYAYRAFALRKNDRNNNLSWRINEQISAQNLRVLDEKGEQVGVMSRNEALEEARSRNTDLIEIAPKAQPPVAKLIELGKFKYQEEKKAQKAKRSQKSSELKEIRFSPFIGDADYKTRLARVVEFLSEGNKVRAVVKFKGRQMGSKTFGYGLFERLLEEVGKDKVVIDMEPKFIGRHLAMVISPTKEIIKKDKPKNGKTEDKKVTNEEI